MSADMGTGWCREHRRQRIVDRFTESTYTRQGEVEYGVTELACGCYDQSPGRIVGAAPGAPYAGTTLVGPDPFAHDVERSA